MPAGKLDSVSSITSQDFALLLGRIAIAVLFVPGGLSKLFNFGRFAASMAGKTLPFAIPLPWPELMAIAAVAIEVLGPLLVLIGFQTRRVALLMIAFTLMATLTTHKYWEMEGQPRRENASNFYKNVGLMGGFLFLYASGAGLISLDGRRRKRVAAAS
jgi:putative oxidoreductase